MTVQELGVIIFLAGLFGFMYFGIYILIRATAEPLDYGVI